MTTAVLTRTPEIKAKGDFLQVQHLGFHPDTFPVFRSVEDLSLLR